MAKRLIDASKLQKLVKEYRNEAPNATARKHIHDGLSTCPMCYIEDKTLVFENHDPDF